MAWNLQTQNRTNLANDNNSTFTCSRCRLILPNSITHNHLDDGRTLCDGCTMIEEDFPYEPSEEQADFEDSNAADAFTPEVEWEVQTTTCIMCNETIPSDEIITLTTHYGSFELCPNCQKQ